MCWAAALWEEDLHLHLINLLRNEDSQRTNTTFVLSRNFVTLFSMSTRFASATEMTGFPL